MQRAGYPGWPMAKRRLTTPDTLTSIAANTRRARERLGWTQSRLAEAMNVEERYIQKIEAAKLNFGVLTLVSLCDALGTTPARLLRPAVLPGLKTGRPPGS